MSELLRVLGLKWRERLRNSPLSRGLLSCSGERVSTLVSPPNQSGWSACGDQQHKETFSVS